MMLLNHETLTLANLCVYHLLLIRCKPVTLLYALLLICHNTTIYMLTICFAGGVLGSGHIFFIQYYRISDLVTGVTW